MPAKPISTSTADRRQAQLEALLAAAEKRICETGAHTLKARDLAADIGVALGGLYNIVQDMDDLLLRLTVRTQGRLDALFERETAHLPMTTRAEALDRLPDRPFRFHAAPPRIKAFGTFPVRAFAMVD